METSASSALGYVGLPLAVEFAEAGKRVVCVDVNAQRIAELRRGESYIEDIPCDRLRAVSTASSPRRAIAGWRSATRSSSASRRRSRANREPDLGAAHGGRERALADRCSAGQLVVLESTTYPGTTRERLRRVLEESGLSVGERLPPRVLARAGRPGPRGPHAAHTPKVIGGLTDACRERADGALRRRLRRGRPRLLPEIGGDGEAAREHLPLGQHRARQRARRSSPTGWASTSARSSTPPSTKPFGFMRFDPGPGMGGHCLPVDPFYLSWRRASSTSPRSSSSSPARSTSRCRWSASRRSSARSTTPASRCAARGSPSSASPTSRASSDIRESPALKIIEHLQERGGERRLPRPARPELPVARARRACRSTRRSRDADVAVIVTAHPRSTTGGRRAVRRRRPPRRHAARRSPRPSRSRALRAPAAGRPRTHGRVGGPA